MRRETRAEDSRDAHVSQARLMRYACVCENSLGLGGVWWRCLEGFGTARFEASQIRASRMKPWYSERIMPTESQGLVKLSLQSGMIGREYPKG
jgi:hypothetical protein